MLKDKFTVSIEVTMPKVGQELPFEIARFGKFQLYYNTDGWLRAIYDGANSDWFSISMSEYLDIPKQLNIHATWTVIE